LGYTRLHRTEIFKGWVIRLFTDELRNNLTGETHTREIVDHPGAVGILPVLPDGRIVLVHEYRHAIEQRLWQIPAGTLEAGESPLESAARELEEETGYAAAHLDQLCAFYSSPGFCNQRMHLYVATGLTPGTQSLDPEEDLTVHPLEPAEVDAMCADGRITDAKTLIGWYRYQDWRAAKSARGEVHHG